ncbi:MAG: HAD family phosphatase, partial [Caldilineaceae bacterium]|nr:HAD family phosphatase [Caldilineaceae bacterium]
LLDLLDTQQIPKAVATSSARAEARYTLANAGLLERFSIVVTGDQVERGKPAPDIFLLTAAQLGVPPSSCLVLEDSEAGVYAATAAGMCTFMVPDLIPPQPETAKRAFQVVESLADVHAWILQCGCFAQGIYKPPVA